MHGAQVPRKVIAPGQAADQRAVYRGMQMCGGVAQAIQRVCVLAGFAEG
ncbi:hypothetical protein [Agrilutibacter solisilvae]|uniref:Uncharacterized protein n=1 Tax=Agrilutibacter solisilvae TaxID=2763317 RepID=A0A975ASA0_9GAMM|nr:hypothetical protein [Lysobacter solisilvae]QSX77844.1 hypothetical protein I8J32_014105 [Lysobacter solisilvae]